MEVIKLMAVTSLPAGSTSCSLVIATEKVIDCSLALFLSKFWRVIPAPDPGGRLAGATGIISVKNN